MRVLLNITNLVLIVFLFPGRSVGQGVGLISAEKQRALHQQTGASVADFRSRLLARKMDTTEIEFRLDTFGVETYFEKCHALLKISGITLTDADMAGLTYDRAEAYDSLMNKYYRRLSGLLKEDDRKVLVQAQRAWLAFRDSEGKLRVVVGMAATGGGTMLQLNESAAYLEMVRGRVVELYEYYKQIEEGL